MSDAEKTSPESPIEPVQPTDDNPEHGEALFSGAVFVSDKKKNLLLTSKGLCLGPASKPKGKSKEEDLLLPWCDVLWADAETTDSEESEQAESAFNVYYIHRQSDKRLCKKCLNVTLEEGGDVSRWVSIIQEECSKLTGRPKKLFVVINPVSGGGKARQIYEKTVGPLFALAHIETTVKVTEKSRHATEIGENEDFTGYNGIVSVGGDGLFQELLQGVILQSQKKAGVDINNSDAKLSKPNITFGVIPAGSGNRVSGWMNDGAIEVESATLRIIRGEQHHGQTVTVYSGDKFIGAGALNCAYGMFVDMIVKRDELAWMGKARFIFAFLSVLLKKRRLFKCEIEYRQAQKKEEKEKDDEGAKDKAQAGWTVYEGKSNEYCSVHAFVVEMVDAGPRYICNPFGKSINLYLDKGCGTMGFFKHLTMIANGKKLSSPIANMEMVENVTGFRIKVLREESETEENVSGTRAKARTLEGMVNIDGEVMPLDAPNLDVRLHSSFVPMFGCVPV